MSIATMSEGETMGRGIPVKFDPRAFRKEHQTPESVLVLGAGPAGLLAAHAVALAGRNPVIASKPAKSEISAATYLHSAIPDLTSGKPDDAIRFEKVGTREGYARKVYGDPRHRTSWDKFEGEHPAWALQPVYDDLWERYSDRIMPIEIDAITLVDLMDEFALVISTIPPSSFCVGDHLRAAHDFPSRPIWVQEGALESVLPQTILYDGRVGAVGDRYRSSRVFGHATTEYADEVPGAVRGMKVQATDCDCFPEVHRAGRWGEWKPGVLVDHAFAKVFSGMFDEFEGA